MASVLVECKQCHIQQYIPEGQDPHDPVKGLQCRCCTIEHNHGEAASACTGSSSTEGPVGHDGTPCWTGEGEKPEGCTVCRPVIHYAMATVFPTAMVSGESN